MVCGGFSCSKNALIVLNFIYILVAFILIGVAAYGRAAAVVTSLTLVGSLIACGVLLFLISLIGLIGAAKHHQVMLFFYMIILFLLFLLQFALACACLAVNADQKDALAEQGWKLASDETRNDVQRQFDCCGFQNRNLPSNQSLGHPKCQGVAKCCENDSSPCCTGQPSQDANCPCDPCLEKMRPVIYNAFSATGGVGLFFSLTEIIGVWITIRFRNQKDPSANPSAFL
ncbi:tetraspanin-13-like isoform X1 [Babylonia areolata]|uniref:tetraspanin-13-like isoform X1 n=1 Tax=Babylonia areolata TaxID=304850 RepID=UPI003FD66ADC